MYDCCFIRKLNKDTCSHVHAKHMIFSEFLGNLTQVTYWYGGLKYIFLEKTIKNNLNVYFLNNSLIWENIKWKISTAQSMCISRILQWMYFKMLLFKHCFARCSATYTYQYSLYKISHSHINKWKIKIICACITLNRSLIKDLKYLMSAIGIICE